jgi:hypothetical protein
MENKINYCMACKNFIGKEKGRRGGLHGRCDLRSDIDERSGRRKACKRYFTPSDGNLGNTKIIKEA